MTQAALERFIVRPASGKVEIYWKSHGSPGEVLIATKDTQQEAEGYVFCLAATPGINKLLNACICLNLSVRGQVSQVLDAAEIIELLKEAGHAIDELTGNRLDDQRLIRRWIGEAHDVIELTLVD